MPRPVSPSSATIAHPNSISLKVRRYLHFDEPIRPEQALKSVRSPRLIGKWQFLPLLRTTVKTRKIKREPSGVLRQSPKERPICYAAHRDAALYQYYSHILSLQYEKLLAISGFSDSVTAFRVGLGKCNIHFAAEAFSEINSRTACTVLALDIQGFFDSLDHQILKDLWSKVLGVERLPLDHFQVFRSITKYAYVERDAIYKRFSISKHNPRAHSRRKICSTFDFRAVVRAEGQIKKNDDCYGIPQGLPISAVLSNIYLLDFDAAVSAACKEMGAAYFRYCDDILIIAPPGERAAIESLVHAQVAKVKLTIQTAKTSIHNFVAGNRVAGKPLQYLGFTFDGKNKLLRNAGITRYYARMRSAVRLADNTRRASDKKTEIKTKIKTKKIFKKYTYLGNKTYLSYAFRSAKLMQDDGIKDQIKAHWGKVKSEISKKEVDY